MLQQMGFGVGIALLIDATLIRSVLLPSAMRLLGERSWYLPRWLRWLPRLDLVAPLRAPHPARAPPPRDHRHAHLALTPRTRASRRSPRVGHRRQNARRRLGIALHVDEDSALASPSPVRPSRWWGRHDEHPNPAAK
jgi:hypothetical protein